MTNGTPEQHLKNLITGEEKDLEKNCGILKDICDFPAVGEYVLLAGYIGSAEPSYREEAERAAEELREKYSGLKIHYVYVENVQKGYLLGCGETGEGKLAALEKSFYNRLILRYRDRPAKAIWTRKQFECPEQIRDAARELDLLLSYALVLEPEGWLPSAGRIFRSLRRERQISLPIWRKDISRSGRSAKPLSRITI